MSEIDERGLQQPIDAVARARDEVRLVYLFGSQAGGAIGPLSDVDLGVLLDRDAPAAQLRAELAFRFAEALGGPPVDLVILNQAPIELAYAVIAQGSLLYERNLVDRVEYEADVMSRYGDFLPFLRQQRREILEGDGSGRRVRRYREALRRTERALGALGASARQDAS